MLIKHFSNFEKDPTFIRASSPITHVNRLPSKAKIILVAGLNDSTVPHEQVDVYFQKAKKLHKNIYLHKVKASHDTKEIAKTYKPLVNELLN